MKTTRFYNAESKCYREHRGEPRKSEVFERNSAQAVRIEIWCTGAYSFGQKVFVKDAEGRWVGEIEKVGDGCFYRNVLAKKQTLMHISREKVSDKEAQEIIEAQKCEAMDAAREAIAWCNEEDEKDEDGRYWLGAYRGAQVYRLIVKDRRIVGSIPGGYHDSCRLCGVCDEAWRLALVEAVAEKVGNDVAIIKADGSGTYFYLRNSEDAKLLNVREYDVLSAEGGYHHNIEVVK